MPTPTEITAISAEGYLDHLAETGDPELDEAVRELERAIREWVNREWAETLGG